MRLIIEGVEVRAVTLQTAPGRAVVALQRETGLKLEEILAKSNEPTEQAWTLKALEFLAEHNRGQFVTFDEVMDRPMAAVLLDPDEQRRLEEAKAKTVGPTPAGTDIPADATPAAPQPPKTASSRRSTPPSRGSKGRSAPVS